MSFFAGAVIAKAILDTTQWVAGGKTMKTSTMNMRKAFSAVGKLAVGMGAAIGAALVKSIMAANEWQKEFSNVTTLLDTSQVNTQEMAKELLLLDARLGSSTDLTKGLYQALSASVEPTQAVEFVADAAKFAKAALIDTNTAVDVITTALNAYGMEADKATVISDQLFSVIKLGKTTGQELSAVIGQSILLAANMGIGFDQLGASIAVMTRQGINASAATTQFNAVINAFLKPSKDMEKTLKEIGFSSGSAAIESLGFKGALDAVVQATGGNNEELAQLFRNTRALRGAMALTGEGAKDFDEILKEVQDSAGATNTAFEKQEITFDTLKNTLDKGQIIVGNIGKIFADKLAVGATQAAQGMIDFLVSSQGAQLVSNIIANVAAGFETLKSILQPLVDTLFKELGKIWETLISALDNIFGGTQKGTGAFKAFAVAGQIVNSIIKIISTVIQGLIENIGNLIKAIQESGGVIGSFFDFITGKKTWDEVKAQADKAGQAFVDFGKGIIDNTVDAFDTVFDEVATFEEKVNQTASDIEVKWKITYTNVKENTLNSYEEMLTGQQDFITAVTTGANSMRDIFNSASWNMQQSSDNTKNKMKDNFLAIQEAGEKAALALEESFRQTGESIMEGMQEALLMIGEGLVMMGEEGKSTSEIMVEFFKDTIAKMVEAFGRWLFLQGIAAAIPGPTFNPIAAAGYFAAAALSLVIAGAIRALQLGGPVSAREPVIVGERGPELFVPATAGQVLSAKETAGIMGKSIVINNYNTISNQADAELVSRKMALRLQAEMRTL